MKILEVLTAKRKTGNVGEKIAAKYLKKQGYKIRELNYVAINNEIDIIAESKTTFAFVEVKTRRDGYNNPKEPRPASAVNPEKQRKIISAAQCYLGRHTVEKKISLDVIEVYLNDKGKKSKVIHIENAFNANTANNRKVQRTR